MNVSKSVTTCTVIKMNLVACMYKRWMIRNQTSYFHFCCCFNFFLVVPPEPSFFQRFIGLFSSKDESEFKFTTNDIEMTTFSVVSGQSPNVLVPTLCCSAAGDLKTQNGIGVFMLLTGNLLLFVFSIDIP